MKLLRPIFIPIFTLAICACGEKEPKGSNVKPLEPIPTEKLTIQIHTDKSNPNVTIPMEFVRIKAGTFYMGADKYEKGADQLLVGEGQLRYPESPKHRVVISTDYLIGKFECTQAQWQAITGNNPSRFTKTNSIYYSDYQTRPVENVSYTMIVDDFMQKINDLVVDNLPANFKEFRLPTEAEWELAARSNSYTRYYWGEDSDTTLINHFSWNKTNSINPNSRTFTTNHVGKKYPNPFGLYDMSGNVAEWVGDRFLYNYYDISPEVDPKCEGTTNTRVVKGGGFNSYSKDLRSARRAYYLDATQNDNIGFRVVIALDKD